MSVDTSLDAEWCPAVNFEPRRNDARAYILLLHYTGMENAQKAKDWLCSEESRVSCHYLIDENGHIVQMVAEEMRAWHAGHAYWSGETDINSVSIGIEIHNPGHGRDYSVFPELQMQALEALSLDILARHDIQPRHVLAHSDVAPDRKQDPGEKFDWARLAGAGIGHWVEPTRIEGDAGFGLGNGSDEIARFQKQLAAYGYKIECDGHFGEPMQSVVIAFQRHFRPALVNGRADHSTIDSLDRLLRACQQG